MLVTAIWGLACLVGVFATEQAPVSDALLNECAQKLTGHKASVAKLNVHGIHMSFFVYDGHDFVSGSLRAGQVWEWNIVRTIILTTKALHNNTKPLVFLDIGANFGYYTLLAARLGYTVHAFEPFASNRKLIEASLCLQPGLRERVHIHDVALSDKNGSCMIFSHPENVGDCAMACNMTEQEGLKLIGTYQGQPYKLRETVPTARLDEEIPSGLAVDVMKIDVEGAEYLTFQGAPLLLGDKLRRPRLIFFEADDGMQQRVSSASVAKLTALLRSQSYEMAGGTERDMIARCVDPPESPDAQRCKIRLHAKV
eukprot:g19609.t1